jgi:peptidoglycan hydrolase-like protein with peptidoglycan-binding domain
MATNRFDWASHFAGHSVGFGVDYSQVQAKLNALGANPPLTVDGAWGPKSKAALVAFQQSKGLTADGIPGPITLGALGIPGAITGGSSGSVTPASSSADAKAYAIAKSAGAKAGMTDKEVQYVVSVAKGEGHYGTGWGSPSAATIAKSQEFGLTGLEGVGSNNWGAVQGTGSAGSFPHVDYHADGTAYKGNYKKYATPEEGFLDMARIILNGGKRGVQGSAEIKAAIAQGNLRNAVYAQHANGYFELNPEKYLSAVLTNYDKIMASVQWPKLLAENGVTAAVAGGVGVFLLILGAGAYLFRKTLFG